MTDALERGLFVIGRAKEFEALFSAYCFIQVEGADTAKASFGHLDQSN